MIMMMMMMRVGLAGLVVLTIAILFGSLPIFLYPKDGTDFQVQNLIQDRLLLANKSGQNEPLNFVVSGASSGLGWGSANHLSQVPNTHTVMACRDLKKCEDAKARINQHPTSKLSCAQLDLESLESIERFAKDIPLILGTPHFKNSSETYVPIHGLVNNAGMWAQQNQERFVQGVEVHMFVNHLGHFFLTHKLWPHLTKSDSLLNKARIVTVSSLVSVLPLDPAAGWFPTRNNMNWLPLAKIFEFIKVYARSKRANLMFAAELHDRYGSQVVSLASHPGYTRTPILLTGLQFMPRWIRQVLYQSPLGSMGILEGAWTQVRPILDHPLTGGVLVGPKYWTAGEAVPVGMVRDTMPSHFWPFTSNESRKLWDQSMEVLGIKAFGE